MFPGRCFPRCFLTVSPTASYKTNVKTTFSGKKIYEFAKCPLKKYVYVQTYIPLHHAGDNFRQWQIKKKKILLQPNVCKPRQVRNATHTV